MPAFSTDNIPFWLSIFMFSLLVPAGVYVGRMNVRVSRREIVRDLERLLAWLKTAVRGGTTVLLGDPGRSYFPKSGVDKLATYRVAVSRDLEDREIRETSVYRLMAA